MLILHFNKSRIYTIEEDNWRSNTRNTSTIDHTALIFLYFTFLHSTIMLSYLIITLLCTATLALQLRTHEYWFLKNNPSAMKGDKKWDYCDLKCLYLEKYYPEKDFVVVVLTAKLHDTFAACYVKTADGYTLWSKVISNTFFEERCGSDYKDWANNG